LIRHESSAFVAGMTRAFFGDRLPSKSTRRTRLSEELMDYSLGANRRSFDCASRDETARGSAQDDKSFRDRKAYFTPAILPMTPAILPIDPAILPIAP
jgi:hypothetical protein